MEASHTSEDLVLGRTELSGVFTGPTCLPCFGLACNWTVPEAIGGDVMVLVHHNVSISMCCLDCHLSTCGQRKASHAKQMGGRDFKDCPELGPASPMAFPD